MVRRVDLVVNQSWSDSKVKFDTRLCCAYLLEACPSRLEFDESDVLNFWSANRSCLSCGNVVTESSAEMRDCDLTQGSFDTTLLLNCELWLSVLRPVVFGEVKVSCFHLTK